MLFRSYTNWTGLSTANSMQSLKYRTRQYPYGSWSAYTSITPTQSAGKWSFSNTISGTYAAGNQYEVEVVATDRLASATLSSVVDTITPIMDIDADTRCVGIGKLHDDDLPEGSLDVAGDIWMQDVPVVETGGTSTAYWTKWANGLCMIYGRIQASTMTKNANSGAYEKTISYPFTLTTVYSAHSSIQYPQGIPSSAVMSYSTSSIKAGTSHNFSNQYVHWLVIGTWK